MSADLHQTDTEGYLYATASPDYGALPFVVTTGPYNKVAFVICRACGSLVAETHTDEHDGFHAAVSAALKIGVDLSTAEGKHLHDAIVRYLRGLGS